MSVSATRRLSYRPYAGWRPGRFPIGTWYSVQSVLGDASGGVRALTFFFSVAPRSTPQSFSLEQISVSDSDSVTKDLSLLTTGFGMSSGGPTAAEEFNWSRKPLLLAGPDGFAFLDPSADLKGVWLGQQVTPDSNATLRVVASNVDGDTLLAHISGYFWDPLAANVEGGPSRPPFGLFPT